MLKRICIVILCIVLFSVSSFAMADSGMQSDDKHLDEIHFLEAIGVIKGYNPGNFAPDKEITRAELAMLAVNALGLDEAMAPQAIRYNDVPIGYWAENYIGIISQLGIMVGYEGYFEPDAYVNAEQTCKVMVEMLGYGKQAQASGGYPYGYAMIAQRLGILDNIDMTGVFTRAKASAMLYNTLHAEPAVIKNISGDYSKYDIGGKTLMETSLRIISAEGRLESDYISSLWGDGACEKNELMIDGVVYEGSEDSYRDLIGRSVSYYYKKESGRKKELVYMTEENKEAAIYEANAENIMKNDASFSSERFVYEDFQGRTQTKNIKDALVFVNGRVTQKPITKNDLSPSDGKVTLIDDNSDGKIDIVRVESYRTVIAKTVNTEAEEIFCEGDDGIISVNDDNFRIAEFWKDGKNVLLSGIKEGDVLLISESYDGKYLRIIASSKAVSAVVSEVGYENSVVADSVSYELNPVFDTNALLIGKTMTLKLDSLGRIADAELGGFTNENYAYLFDVMKKEGISNRIVVKLMTLEGKIEIVESTDKINFNGGGNVEAKSVYDKICVDGETKQTLVVYGVNPEGLLNRLYTPEENSDYITLDYPQGERSYSKNANIFGLYESGGFAIDSGAPVFYIAGGSEEDSKLMKVSDLIHKETYTVEGYNAGDTMTPKVMVIKVAEGANGDMSITYQTPIGVIDKISYGIDSKDEEVPVVTMISGGQELKFFAKPKEKINSRKVLYPNNKQSSIEFSEFKRGDLVYYTTDYNGNIEAICKILPYGEDTGIFEEAQWMYNRGWSSERTFGTPDRISGNLVEVSAGGMTYFYSLAGANVTVVDIAKDEIYSGSLGEIVTSSLDSVGCSRLFIAAGEGKVTDVVIYNNRK